jgi:dipeptidyl aminopeptidase/acylaminoacyl peptidase
MWRKGVRALGVALCGLCVGAALQAAEPAKAAAGLLPVEQFTKWPDIRSAHISPSGRRLALILTGPTGRWRLGVMDLDPIGQIRVVADYTDANVVEASWITDDRLAYEAADPGAVIREGGYGVFAVNHDGSEFNQLVSARGTTQRLVLVKSRMLPWGWTIHSPARDGSNDVFLEHYVWDNLGELSNIQLARMDSVTMKLTNLSQGAPDGVRGWTLDRQGQPRVVTAEKNGQTSIHWRNPKTDQWEKVAEFDSYDDKGAGFTPELFDGSGQLLVSGSASSDTRGKYRFDLATRRLDPDPVMSVKGFDVDGAWQVDSGTGQVLGVHFRADRPISAWFDPAMQRLQKGLDAALPAGRSNRILCRACESGRFIVVHSTSDRQPGEYFLFDRKKNSLAKIASQRPWIDESTQGTRSFHRVKMRDGLTIPVYVTSPAGASDTEPLPAVMLVHGGPFVRGGDVSWDAEAQFLASRGYRVIQPEFRGSEGYGGNLFRAGWKQWGLAMQDDLADSIRWAAAQKLVDPARVCIYGGSYGGYAALMGGIASPGVYRCAASFAGVTDINLMRDIGWSDMSEEYRKYGMPVLVGDPVKDAAQFAATSPLKRVAEIKIPVLLAHGSEDRRVPIEHARKFVSAARDAGVDIEMVDYFDEGHGFYTPKNEADFYGRLERFLAKSLKPAR